MRFPPFFMGLFFLSAVLFEQFLRVRDLAGDFSWRCRTVTVPLFYTVLDAELAQIVKSVAGESARREVVFRDFWERFSRIFAEFYEVANALVSLAERHPLEHEVFGDVRGLDKTFFELLCQNILAEANFFKHVGENGQRGLERVDAVKQGFFVLLIILVEREERALEHRQQRDEIADGAGGFSAYEFRDVGIFFLRHDARTGAKRVVDLNKTEFLRVKNDQLLGETAEMHHAERGIEEVFGKRGTRTDRIKGVFFFL